MSSNSFAGRRRSNFSRSHTLNSQGPCPMDAEKLAKSSSTSSNSSLISQIIVVQSNPNMMDSSNWFGIDEKVYRVQSFLLCSDDSTPLDSRFICNENIGFIVNATSVAGTSAKIVQTSCSCPDRCKYEAPKEVNLKLDSMSTPKEIVNAFKSVNELIREGRRTVDKILIYYGRKRKCVGIVLSIQYMMEHYNISSEQAIIQWMKNCCEPRSTLSENYAEALRIWEKKLNKSKHQQTL